MAGRSRSTRTGEPSSKFNPTENAVQRTRSFTGLWVVVAGDVAIASAAIYGVIRSGTGQNATQIVAILTSAFTAVGTMTTAYFGIRAVSNTAQAATADAAQTTADAAQTATAQAATATAQAATAQAAAAQAAAGQPNGEPKTPGAGGTTEAHVDSGGLTETIVDLPEEEITEYDGATELDQEGDPQPVADAPEDDDPAALAGEELPDEEEAP
jgi:hypothetical protein